MTPARMLEALAEGGPFTVEVRGDRHYVGARGGRVLLGPVGGPDRAAELVAVLADAAAILDAREVNR